MRKVAILLAGTEISGGVAVILEHARNLAGLGISVVLVTNAKHDVNELAWSPAFGSLLDGSVDIKTFWEFGEERVDVAIATYWKTCFNLHRINAEKYLYFVQSIESRFARDGEVGLKMLIESTYDIGLGVITISKWMVDYLKLVHDTDACVVRNGINKQVFRSDGPQSMAVRPAPLRVLIEGPIDVPFKNVPATIDACNRADVKSISLLTSSRICKVNGVHRVFSNVTMEKVGEIYRAHDVLVKLSIVEGMFGPPLEMFHCNGTAVVFDVTGHDEYLRHGYNGIVVRKRNYDEVVRWLRILSEDQSMLTLLKNGATATAAEWPSWPDSTNALLEGLREASARSSIDRQQLRQLTRRLWTLYRLTETGAADRRISSEPNALKLRSELEAMKASTSWRVTQPIRYIGRRMPKIRRALKRLYGAA